MAKPKYSDEIKKDSEFGLKVRVRHLETMPPKLEENLERTADMEQFIKLVQSITKDKCNIDPLEGRRILRKYIDIDSITSGEELHKQVVQKLEQFQKEANALAHGKELDSFLESVTDGRYPSFLTLNHSGSAEPASKVNGGVFVCSYKNAFWSTRQQLYVFGTRNSGFKEYLRQIREAAEKVEGKQFFKELPLSATKEQLLSYTKTNKNAGIMTAIHKNPKEAIRKFGTDLAVQSSAPVGLTRINGRVKKQDPGEAVISAFMSAFNQTPVKTEGNVRHMGSFAAPYYGRDNIEAVTAIYSGFPFVGLGDWGGRIEVNASNVQPEVYKDFDYRFCDLAEMMIDLRNRRVVFFNVE